MNYKIVTIMLCLTLTTAAFTGCSAQDTGSSDVIATDSTDAQVISSSSVTSVSSSSDIATEDMFTDRDKEIGYDETTSVKITLADGASTSASSSVSIDGDTITITDEGTYILSGNLSDGQLIIDADSTDKVQLVLDNADINCRTSAAIYVRTADKVFITLAPSSVNSLSNSDDFVAIDDNNIDAVIFSKSDLTLNGSGTLNVTAVYGHGILSKDDLKFTSGTYVVSAADSALSGKDSVRIADGNFNLTAGKDGIHSENADDEDKGYIYIAGGSFTINADSDGLDSSSTMQIDGGTFNITVADDAFHSDTELIVNDGDINISTCYEGLEAQSITINGGTIDLYATDDGFNAAGGNDQSGFGGRGGDSFGSGDCIITINGGVININADGDGIDSNGDLIVNGGEVYVSGPTDSANGALDYGGSAEINGGYFVAVGSSGMAQNFGSASTQGSIMITLSSYAEAGSDIILKSSDGSTLLSYTAQKRYNNIVISCPDIEDGGTYTITAGDSEATVTMDGLIYGGSMGGGFGGGMNDRMNDGMNDGMRGGMKDNSGDASTPEELPSADGQEAPSDGFTFPDGQNGRGGMNNKSMGNAPDNKAMTQ
ncbi:MAG: carbohydrate-binding domain-containing protein [Lachnospiraceae bacterium]|nr:carbohydrate-binding domain-containing protein [Lachnospiraceae bacterium]